jgi:hypothetical protein
MYSIHLNRPCSGREREGFADPCLGVEGTLGISKAVREHEIDEKFTLVDEKFTLVDEKSHSGQ